MAMGVAWAGMGDGIRVARDSLTAGKTLRP